MAETRPTDAELLNDAFQAALDDLDKASTTCRKMIRHAKSREDALELREELRRINNLIEETAIVQFDKLANSPEIREITKGLNKITEDLKDARRKMTTTAKTITQATKVIDIVATALRQAAKLVA